MKWDIISGIVLLIVSIISAHNNILLWLNSEKNNKTADSVRYQYDSPVSLLANWFQFIGIILPTTYYSHWWDTVFFFLM